MCVVWFSELYFDGQNSADFRGHLVGGPSNENQHPWHHSVDKRCYFFPVKFKVRFVGSFRRKPISNKKWHFSWEGLWGAGLHVQVQKSELRWTTCALIWKGYGRALYLLNDTMKHGFGCRTGPWTLQKVLKKVTDWSGTCQKSELAVDSVICMNYGHAQ
jgi:hypothetical protein